MSARKRRANPFTLFSFQDIITSVMGIMLLSALLLAVELTHRQSKSPEMAATVAIDSISSALESIQNEIPMLQAELDALTGKAQNIAETVLPGIPERKSIAGTHVKRLKAESASLLDAVKLQSAKLDKLQAEKFDRRGDIEKLDQLKQDTSQAEAELTALSANKRLFFNPALGTSKRPWVIDYAKSRILVGPLPNPQSQSEAPQEFLGDVDLLDFCRTLSADDNYFLLMIRPSGAKTHHELVQNLRNRKFDLGFDLLGASQEIFPGKLAP